MSKKHLEQQRANIASLEATNATLNGKLKLVLRAIHKHCIECTDNSITVCRGVDCDLFKFKE